MRFPQGPLGATVELLLAGTWTDVTHRVRRTPGVTITRGRADEASTAGPARASMVLDNRDGRLSPRNPRSPWAGLLGRNTPLRVRVAGIGPVGVDPAPTGIAITTPDDPAHRVSGGDLDLRADAQIDWDDDGTIDLIGGFTTPGSLGYRLGSINGFLYLQWSFDGFASRYHTSSVPTPLVSGDRACVRATLQVDDGAGGHVVRFSTGPTLGGPWTEFGAPVVTTGTMSVYTSPPTLQLGGVGGTPGWPRTFTFHGGQIRDGIDGTLVAAPDVTAQTPGTTGWTDTVGRPWTVADGATVTDALTRFVGEVPSWPQSWDVAGSDVTTTIEASGVMRRLGAGAANLRSPLFRGIVAATGVPRLAYWPCEDANGSTQLASGLPEGRPMTVWGDNSGFAGYDRFACSAPIPTVKNGRWTGRVPPYVSSGHTQVRFLLAIPAAGESNNAVVARAVGTGTVSWWNLVYVTTSGGSLVLVAYDRNNTQLLNTGPLSAGLDGSGVRVSLELIQNGANVDWCVVTLAPGAGSIIPYRGTLTGRTVGAITTVQIDPSSGLIDTAVGHVSVQNEVTTLFDLAWQLAAWDGETAGVRIDRLCREEGIPVRVQGRHDVSEAMGPQTTATLVTLLGECQDTDGGILHEPRDMIGVAYRTRASLCSQAPTLALDYATPGHVVPPLTPTDDDQHIRNDVTVSRTGGSSARALDSTTALSTAPPPAGVGAYTDQTTVSAHLDARLEQLAAWRLHMGTVDEARYPVLTVDLASMRRDPTGDALSVDATTVDVGDRLTVGGLPAWLPPAPVDQLAAGMSETLTPTGWTIALNCAPAAPYRVAVIAAGEYAARVGSGSSTLAVDATDTDTTLLVSSTGVPWTTDPADVPFDVAVSGVRITVTAVTAGSVQSLTVTRSVDGFDVALTAGVPVDLWQPTVVGL